MPVKRRISKNRSIAEIEAWGTVFGTGYDFFQEVWLLTGLRDPDGPIDTEEKVAQRQRWHEAVREAWHRLGAQWLAIRDPNEDCQPWALEEFGAP